jgi:hypothetical protein
MADFTPWIRENWSAVVSAAGILGSLWFTGAYFRQDSKSRNFSNLLAIDERHRALWTEARQRQDLKRVFSRDADVLSLPISFAEEEFLKSVFVHFETGWRIECLMNRGELKTLSLDVAAFFSLPLPRAIWEKTKQYRNPKFVKFVMRALEGCGR